jgi:TRAP-type C4-dicarboxylate transport system permease small subunit
MHARRFDHDLGLLLFGAILLIVGGYYMLTNTFGVILPELNWDMIWPLFVIALGVGLVWRAINERSSPTGPH